MEIRRLVALADNVNQEAYVLAAAIEGWTRKETDEQIRLRAAEAYHKYQHCGLKAARGLFATGW